MMKYDVFNYQGTELSEAQDLSGMDFMHVDIWTLDATVVKVTPISQSSGEFLVSLTPITPGSWNSYDIPLGDFTGVSMADIFQLKFDGQDGVTPSTIYLDNIYFYTEGGSGSDNIGIYSETYTDQMLSYSQIINSADWSGNSAAADEMNTDVTPLDGSYVLGVEFTDFGAGWGGIAFDFGSQDISGSESLVLSIDHSDMPTLNFLGVKLEDNAGGNTEVNISSYTPETFGNWSTYTIPLSVFTAVDLTDSPGWIRSSFIWHALL